MGHGPVDVVIAIPARNEEDRIVACLESALAAVSAAQAAGVVGSARIGVAAHRCHDQTAQLSRHVLIRGAQGAAPVDGLVWESPEPAPVGAVRSALIDRLLSTPGAPEERLGWVFSTDADSVVPKDWLRAGLELADVSGADVVAGLIDLDPREVTPTIRLAHDRIIRAGIRADGSHEHVYAANLAIRAETYRALGGFPAVPSGEEQALLDRARRAGVPVLSTTRWRVRTSARTAGRAPGGLGDLLGRLAEPVSAAPLGVDIELTPARHRVRDDHDAALNERTA